MINSYTVLSTVSRISVRVLLLFIHMSLAVLPCLGLTKDRITSLEYIREDSNYFNQLFLTVNLNIDPQAVKSLELTINNESGGVLASIDKIPISSSKVTLKIMPHLQLGPQLFIKIRDFSAKLGQQLAISGPIELDASVYLKSPHPTSLLGLKRQDVISLAGAKFTVSKRGIRRFILTPTDGISKFVKLYFTSTEGEHITKFRTRQLFNDGPLQFHFPAPERNGDYSLTLPMSFTKIKEWGVVTSEIKTIKQQVSLELDIAIPF